MDSRTMGEFRERLIHARKQAVERLAGVETSAGFDRSEADWSGELSAYDNHTADSGSAIEMRSTNVGLIDRIRVAIDRIDDALARMDRGDYGKCTQCGVDIPLERLMVIPYAEHCISCGEKERNIKGAGDRPIEEWTIRPPFGGTGRPTGRVEDQGITGEDIWNDLVPYGTASSPQDEGLTEPDEYEQARRTMMGEP